MASLPTMDEVEKAIIAARVTPLDQSQIPNIICCLQVARAAIELNETAKRLLDEMDTPEMRKESNPIIKVRLEEEDAD